MKSKYAELFTAKLNDMGLVLFEKHRDWESWTIAKQSGRCFMVSDNFEYFLCLPQHKDAVINCLNGGVSEVFGGSGNFDRGDAVIGSDWSSCSLLWYMNDACESRIKPKKEKRWIAVNGKTGKLHETLFRFPFMDTPSAMRGFEQIEIEVEV
ncbi:conserved hypothetical protein [Vibrio phage 191E37-1]|nr:conserved hypothetical protein [Vibrio phage 191E37-1]